MLKNNLTDPKNGRTARIGLDGRLFTGPAKFSDSFNGTLGVDDAVVNIVPAVSDQKFIITDIILTGNKNIDPNIDAVVEVYQASSATSAVQDKLIISVSVPRSGQVLMSDLFLTGGETKWINADTSDDDVNIVILGYYVKNGEED